MRRKLGKTIGAVLVILIVVFLGVRYKNATTPGDPEKDGYTKNIKYLNQNASVYLYGADIEFREKFQYTRIDFLDKEVAKSGEKPVYLIINELDGKVTLKKEDVVWLKKAADTNNQFNFIYLGTDKLDFFTKGGIFDDGRECEGEMSFGYALSEGDRTELGGIWTEDEQKYVKMNKELLGQLLVLTMADLVSSNE